MTSFLSAGAIFALSAGVPATFDSSGYSALTYTTVGEIDTIAGDIGRVYSIQTRNPLALRATVKKKGTYNDGNFTVTLALDYDDSGQDLARTAAGSDNPYAFRIQIPGSDTIYGQILVAGFTFNLDGPDSFMMAQMVCEIITSSTGVGIVVVEA